MTLVVYLVVRRPLSSSSWPAPGGRSGSPARRCTCGGSSTRCRTRRPERVAHGGSYFEQSEWWRHPRTRHLRGRTAVHGPGDPVPPRAAHAQPVAVVPLVPVPLRPLPARRDDRSSCSAARSTARLVGRRRRWRGTQVIQWLAGLTGAAGLVLAVAGADRPAPPPADRPGAPGVHDARRHLQPARSSSSRSRSLGAGYATRGAAGARRLRARDGPLGLGRDAWPLPPAARGRPGRRRAAGAYVPLTHMSHFVAKYFTYHSVRWDDEPMDHNARRAVALAEYLHVQADVVGRHIRRHRRDTAPGPRSWRTIRRRSPSDEGPARLSDMSRRDRTSRCCTSSGSI